MKMHNLLKMISHKFENLWAGTPVSPVAVSQYVSISFLTPTKAIMCYIEATQGKARIFNISGTTITFAASSYIFETGSTSNISVSAVSETKAVVAFCDIGDSSHGKACVLDVAGDVITPRTAATFLASNGPSYTSTCVLSPTKVIVAYRHFADSKGYACVLDITGAGLDTITPGTPVEFEDGATTYTSVATLTATKAITAFVDGGDSSKGKARILDISGATITPGDAAVVFETGITAHVSVAIINSTLAVVAFMDDDDSDQGKTCLLNCAASTIVAGTAIVFNAAATDLINTKTLNEQQILIFFRNVGDASKGTSILVHISGITLTVGDSVIFENDALVYRTEGAVGSANKGAVCYSDASLSYACIIDVG